MAQAIVLNVEPFFAATAKCTAPIAMKYSAKTTIVWIAEPYVLIVIQIAMIVATRAAWAIRNTAMSAAKYYVKVALVTAMVAMRHFVLTALPTLAMNRADIVCIAIMAMTSTASCAKGVSL